MGKKQAASSAEPLTANVPSIPYEDIIVIHSDNSRRKLVALDELAEEIELDGLLQPIGVRARPGSELTDEEKEALGGNVDVNKTYGRLVFGFRRHGAIGKLREKYGKDGAVVFEKVPYTLLDVDASDAEFANLNENLDRENLSPADLAQRFFDMKTKGEKTVEEIASRVKSVSAVYIRGLISLRAKLCPEAWEAFDAGKLSYDTAQEIRKAGNAESQQAALEAALGAIEAAAAEGKKRSGAKKAAAEAVADEKESKGESAPRTGVLRPKQKEIQAVYDTRAEEAGDTVSDFEYGVQVALEWVMGNRKRIPKSRKTK